jgi:hypothetical protein
LRRSGPSPSDDSDRRILDSIGREWRPQIAQITALAITSLTDPSPSLVSDFAALGRRILRRQSGGSGDGGIAHSAIGACDGPCGAPASERCIPIIGRGGLLKLRWETCRPSASDVAVHFRCLDLDGRTLHSSEKATDHVRATPCCLVGLPNVSPVVWPSKVQIAHDGSLDEALHRRSHDFNHRSSVGGWSRPDGVALWSLSVLSSH